MTFGSGISAWCRRHPGALWAGGLLAIFSLGTLVLWGWLHPDRVAEGITWARGLLVGHPGLLFATIALLPAAGFPVSVLLVLGGYVFQDRYGAVLGVLVVLLAISLNIMISYWIAKRFAPWFRDWFQRRGYPLPEMRPGTALQVTVLVRVTPGMPLFVQNYLLGVLMIPWRTYLIGSFPPQWIVCAILATGGGALLAGNWGVVAGAVVFFLLLAMVLRRVYLAIGERTGG